MNIHWLLGNMDTSFTTLQNKVLEGGVNLAINYILDSSLYGKFFGDDSASWEPFTKIITSGFKQCVEFKNFSCALCYIILLNYFGEGPKGVFGTLKENHQEHLKRLLSDLRHELRRAWYAMTRGPKPIIELLLLGIGNLQPSRISVGPKWSVAQRLLPVPWCSGTQ